MATTPGTFTVCDLPRDSFPPFLRYRLGRAMTPLLQNPSIQPEVAAVGFLRMTADWLNLVKLCDGDSPLVKTSGGRENLLRGTVAGARLAVGDVRVSRHSMTLVQPNVAAVERAAEGPLALQLNDALGDLALAQVVQSLEREDSFFRWVSLGAAGVGAVFLVSAICVPLFVTEGPVVLAAVTIAPSVTHLLYTVGLTLEAGAALVLVTFYDSPRLVPALEHLRDDARTVIVPKPS